MPNYANATIVGHVGRDPETKHSADGKQVTSFSVATTRKTRGEDQTTWWRVSTFGRTAEVAEKYVRKGAPVLVSGEPVLREYQAKDGTTKTSLEIAADRLTLLGSKQDAEPRQEQQAAPRRAAQPAKGAGIEDMESDIPF